MFLGQANPKQVLYLRRTLVHQQDGSKSIIILYIQKPKPVPNDAVCDASGAK